MPALNGNRNTRSNNSNNNGSVVDNILKEVSFSRVFAIVMATLSLKERWDNHKAQQEDREFRRTLLERQAANPSAAAVGGLNPPPYRDNPSSEDLVGLSNTSSQATVNPPLADDDEPLELSTRKKRPTGCCVCCGIRCDLIFKTLGIAILLYLCFGLFKFYRWMSTPSPTGLEDMPEYSTSLGCDNVPYHYEKDIFEGIVPTAETSLILDISGGAIGTVLLTEADSDAIKIDMALGTNEEPLLEKIAVSLQDNSTAQTTTFSLSTPSSATYEDACMRFDILVHIPRKLRLLTLISRSLLHLKYDDHASIYLSNLVIDMKSASPDNLLLPSSQLETTETKLDMRGGYLVGSLSFHEKAEITTARGSAITNLKIAPLAASTDSPDQPATLNTRAGSGRIDVIYSNPDRRVMSSTHQSSGGDMYLTYQGVGYNGRVDMKAQSSRSSGLQGTMGSRPGEKGELPWVGEKDGPDHMEIRTSGWVGVWF